MSKTILASLFLVFLSSCGDKVDIDADQAKTFNKIYGNAGQDLGRDIFELEDGSFLIFGSIEVANRGTDLAVIKTDRFGNQIWQSTHGSEFNEIAGGFDINTNGNILIAGTRRKDEDSTGSTANLSDIVVYELDNQGQLLNQQIFDTLTDNEKATCILYDKTSVGGYMVGGSTDAERAEFGSFLANDKGNLDALTIRYINSEATFFVAGFEGDDEITDMVRGDIQEGGEEKYWPTGYRTTPNGIKDGLLFRLENNNKAFAFFEDFPTITNQTPTQMLIDADGFFLIGSQNEGNTGNESIFVKRIDRALTVTNEIIISQTSNSFRGQGISFDAKTGNYVICGTTNLTQNGGFDHYIASLKVDGTINWQRTFGGSGDEEALSITTTSDGGYIIAGYTGFEGNGLMNVIKTNNLGILNP